MGVDWILKVILALGFGGLKVEVGVDGYFFTGEKPERRTFMKRYYYFKKIE